MKKENVVIFRPINGKAIIFILVGCLSPNLLVFFTFFNSELWWVILIATSSLSIYLLFIVCFFTELSLIFRKIVIDYRNKSITAKKEFSLRLTKLQKSVSFNLLDVYKLELAIEKIYKNKRNSPSNLMKVARFFLFDDTIETVVLDYLSGKRIDEFVKTIHHLNPNIYIIGFGYNIKVIVK